MDNNGREMTRYASFFSRGSPPVTNTASRNEIFEKNNDDGQITILPAHLEEETGPQQTEIQITEPRYSRKTRAKRSCPTIIATINGTKMTCGIDSQASINAMSLENNEKMDPNQN